MYRYGEALLENGKQTKGKSWIKQAWSVGNFPKKLERHILKKHLALFTQADHEKRLDRLLWERGATAATRMLPYVSKGQKKLAIARIRLMKMAGNVDAAVNSVPVELQNDPSLIYERAKWRRRKSLHDGSRELLLQIDETVPKAEKWWLERHIQARKLLAMGHVSDAYRLVSQHGLTEGGDFATAEWLSGWIALRFLGDHDVATKHFVRLFENVSFPISRARGAYWIGRTQLALNDTKKANFWFEIAARHYTTFYGQMALHEMGKRRLPLIPEINGPDASILTAYAMDERVMVIRHLGELEKSKWAKSFLLKMAEDVSRPEEYTYLAALATEIGRPDYAISVAKRAHQLGTDLTEINWPTKSVDLDNPAIELPLILAITRQESAFAIDAISSAGARGLMQLMPATAKNVSKKLNVSYSKSLLTEDANYNTLLGSSYLGNLIDRYNGSYVLAIASYNAGPSRVRSWIKEWGDPRTGEIDMVDWIELIPISETRNYVQRVIENLQVYRQRLNRNRISLLQIDKDINRGSETH
ncbi:MAG: lytic murein transglycosylase [Sneathiella sp.]|nr:MAG: lytic murein transglycosylase [Sneathiella sp.]